MQNTKTDKGRVDFQMSKNPVYTRVMAGEEMWSKSDFTWSQIWEKLSE